jgi:hypothetical protein
MPNEPKLNPRHPSRGDRVFALVGLLAAILAAPAAAQHSDVASTLHNLSLSGPGEIRSTTETEVCKFCHIPHNAEVPDPLWGHALSDARYEVPEIRTGGKAAVPAPQPDGASRLCLSCHDGTVALGDITSEPRPVPMSGAERLGPSHRGFIGTDLSGSHPVSFVMPESTEGTAFSDSDMALKPRSSLSAEKGVTVDKEGKMQCTTCHDPHSDQYYQEGRVPRFWVRPTVDEVCLSCHAVR